MNASEYKKFHESFMQNNHGSTPLHTFLCIFFTVQCAIYISIRPKYSTFYQYVYEYTIMVLSMILAHTVLAEYIYILNFVVFTILLYELCIRLHIQTILKKFMQKNINKNDRIPFVTTIRGLTYIITVLAILAVDFQVFPRYLAKTERYGYSLMDTGVGLFVVVSGIVHKDLGKGNYKDIIKGNIKVITILILLGIGRFISVKQLDYHEHVTEYGVHWNFFFTIALCKLISTITLFFSNRALTLSIICLIIHEFMLYIGLQSWVFSDAPRNSLISANREGISSSLGYVAIYLYAASVKQTLLTRNVTKWDIQRRLILQSIVLWTLTYTINIIRPTSRTLANASYCIYLDTILVTVTSVLYFINVLFEERNMEAPLILSSINTNGLTYFLLANLLTGAVNLSMRTLLVSSTIAIIILNVYMIATIVLIVYVKKLGLRI